MRAVKRKKILTRRKRVMSKEWMRVCLRRSAEQDSKVELHSTKGSGQPLPRDIRQEMEASFGRDFSGVRVYSDHTAKNLTNSLRAQAFTQGQDIYFAPPKLDNSSDGGKRLLAHELTHTIQQLGGSAKSRLPSTVNPIVQCRNTEENEQPRSSESSREASGGSPIETVGAKSEEEAGRIAEEVYNALDWWNDNPRAIRALSGHDEDMRNLIKTRFAQEHGSIKNYLKRQLSGDWLVNAFALLSSSHYHDLHAAMARSLIPLGTRDREIFRILERLSLGNRQLLKQKYNQAFHDIGRGSLENDLKGDLSGWAEKKSLALLRRNLTSADHLYFDSVAITGTRYRICNSSYSIRVG